MEIIFDLGNDTILAKNWIKDICFAAKAPVPAEHHHNLAARVANLLLLLDGFKKNVFVCFAKFCKLTRTFQGGLDLCRAFSVHQTQTSPLEVR